MLLLRVHSSFFILRSSFFIFLYVVFPLCSRCLCGSFFWYGSAAVCLCGEKYKLMPGHVPQPHRLVAPAGGQPLAVGCKCQALDLPFVSGQPG